MCAIVDANVAHEVFGVNQTPAGKRLYDWINEGQGRLVIGGRLTEELNRASAKFPQWAKRALLFGRIRSVNDDEIRAKTKSIVAGGKCVSNDMHIVSLAQVSGARLLFSNDGDLHTDFRNKTLINNPRGQIFSTRMSGDLTSSHKRLLARKDLCRAHSS